MQLMITKKKGQVDQGYATYLNHKARDFFDSLTTKTTEYKVVNYEAKNLLITCVDYSHKLHQRVYESQAALCLLLGFPHQSGSSLSPKYFADYYTDGRLVDAAKSIDGGWAAFLYDKKNDSILIISSKFCSPPLYYTETETEFVITTRVRAAKSLCNIKSDINLERVLRYASCNYRATFGRGDTFYQGISMLLSGWELRLEKSEIRLRRYWDFDGDAPILPSNFSDLSGAYRELLVDEVGKTLTAINHQNWAIALSGGLDSSSILGIARHLGNETARTVSIVYPDSDSFNERAAIEQNSVTLTEGDTCETLSPKLMLHFLTSFSRRIDQPLATATLFSFDRLLALAHRNEITNIFTGSGGDQIQLGNYTAFPYALADIRNSDTERFYLEVDRWIQNFSTSDFPKSSAALAALLRARINEHSNGTLRNYNGELTDRLINKHLITDYSVFDVSTVRSYGTYSRSYAVQEYLYEASAPLAEAEADMCWYYGCDFHSPMLNTDLVDFGWSLPLSAKYSYGTSKVLARDSLIGICPDTLLSARTKQGFNAPFGDWVRGEIKEFLFDNILVPNAKIHAFYNRSRLEECLNLHMSRRNDYSMLLWQALQLELWLKEN